MRERVRRTRVHGCALRRALLYLQTPHTASYSSLWACPPVHQLAASHSYLLWPWLRWPKQPMRQDTCTDTHFMFSLVHTHTRTNGGHALSVTPSAQLLGLSAHTCRTSGWNSKQHGFWGDRQQHWQHGKRAWQQQQRQPQQCTHRRASACTHAHPHPHPLPHPHPHSWANTHLPGASAPAPRARGCCPPHSSHPPPPPMAAPPSCSTCAVRVRLGGVGVSLQHAWHA